MRPSEFLLIPFLLQACAMMVDEFYFHRRRGLPRWERIGHPLDTITVLACYACVLFFAPVTSSIALFVGLSIFSCVFVTKDEFIHKEKCSAAEMWLHSVLFILHPVAFSVIGWVWIQGGNSLLWTFIQGQAFIILAFLLYQIIYWNVLWKTEQV